MNLARLYHTAKYLKAGQIVGRFTRRLVWPWPDLRPACPLRERRGPWVEPCARPCSMLAPARFRFLEEDREVATVADWNRPDWPMLWRYNLHYFDDLRARDRAERWVWHRNWLDRWVRENPPGRRPGWDPYPTSLRIVNWVIHALNGQDLGAGVLDSLAVQARWLRRRVEWHLRANHVLANLKALLFAGLYFDKGDANDWIHYAARWLNDQLAEQILPDGGHYERSPMYHALILEDLLDMINILRAYGFDFPCYEAEALRMLDWLAAMRHPDGGIPLFNDAAHGVAPAPAELFAYADRLNLRRGIPPMAGATWLKASGYVRATLGPATLFLDLAPLGPDHQPAHGHADTLGFEFALQGARVLVDPGVSLYEPGPERARQRSTAVHNTLTVDGADSSEVWGGFRVARRARVHGATVDETSERITVAAAHDGYRRLPGVGWHRRRWELSRLDLAVYDTLDAAPGRTRGASGGAPEVVVVFQFHPEITVDPRPAGAARILRAGHEVARFQGDEALSWSLETRSYHPRFGVSLDAPCLVGRARQSLPASFVHRLAWS